MKNPFKTIDRHASLLNRMAEATEADMSDAALDGRQSAETYRKALRDCTHCQSVDQCLSWLDTSPQEGGEPPAFCANRDVLTKLAKSKA